MISLKKRPKTDNHPIPPELLAFHPDVVEMEHAPIPRSALYTQHLVILLIVFLITWSCLASLDILVQAPGKIVSEGKNIVVSPLETGIIRSINVHVGQIVKKDQILAELDPTFTSADAAQAANQVNYYTMLTARLDNELTGKPFIVPAESLTGDTEAQIRLLQGRQDEFNARLKSYNSTIYALKEDIHALENQEALYKERVSISDEVVDMRQKVYESGADSRLSLLDSKNFQKSTHSDYEKIKGDLATKRSNLAQSLTDKEAFINSWRNDVFNQLTSSRKELTNALEQLKKAKLTKELATLVAPSEAVVLDVAKYPTGAVVQGGETIITLVPLNVPLEALTYVDPQDIGYIRQGDFSRLKLETFPFQKYGAFNGLVRTIGEDATQINTGDGQKLVYEVRISITDSSEMHNLPSDFRLIPGMTLIGDIKVGSRKVITYLMWPLTRAVDQAIREP